MGEGENGQLRLEFDTRLRLELRRPKVITDEGLLAVREFDKTLRLTEMGSVRRRRADLVGAREILRGTSKRSRWRLEECPKGLDGNPAMRGA